MLGRRGQRQVGRSVLLGLAGLAIVVSGCTAAPAEGGNPTSATAAPSSAPPPPAPPVTLNIKPGDKAVDVPPGEPIVVDSLNGKLTQVTLAGQDGRVVAGQMTGDSRSWTSTEPLGYGKNYTATAAGVGEDGKPATVTSTFSTARPKRQVDVAIGPFVDGPVGVGQPLVFSFGGSVPDKAAAERAIRITTTPQTTGAFYWMDSSTVHWRPQEYWKPGTKIS